MVAGTLSCLIWGTIRQEWAMYAMFFIRCPAVNATGYSLDRLPSGLRWPVLVEAIADQVGVAASTVN